MFSMRSSELDGEAVTHQPAVVLPCHDPEGRTLALLEGVTPQLKGLFSRAFLGVTPETLAVQTIRIARMRGDGFFSISESPEAAPVGMQFRALYQRTAECSPPELLLHLCFPDRLVYALLGPERDAFKADMRAEDATPLLYQRSPAAWATHPQNYRVAESVVTQLGVLVLGRVLDFCWCHLALTAQRLGAILPQLNNPSLAIMAEMVLCLHDGLNTREVDWLAWEDPLILGRDAKVLKLEREGSFAEARKRLDYVEPMTRVLFDFSRKREALCCATPGC